MSRRAVSVVVPTKDRPVLLRWTLDTLLAQLDVEIEVIVVDDGSAEPVVVEDRRVRVIRHDRSQGIAIARNVGVAAARHPWIAFVDDDDLWAPTKLARQLDALATAPGAAWCAVGTAYLDGDLRLLRRSLPPRDGDVAADLLATNGIPGGGSGVLAAAALVRELGGFDTSLAMCADYDMWIRLALAAPFVGVADPLLGYRVHDGAMSRNLECLPRELAMIEEKHGAERRARGAPARGFVYLWAGDRLQRSGSRIGAARLYLRAGGTGTSHGRAAGRAAEALLWPGAYALRDARRAREVPDEWRVALDAWLDPLRVAGFASSRRVGPDLPRESQL